MILLVGLGNPGQEYAHNRHNIGFMALDVVARKHGFSPWRAKFHGEVCEGLIAGEKVIALKPLTYMNESGRSVLAAATFYKVAPEDIIVLHDELDLPPSKLKVKTGGGHAGHNGLRSIQAHLGPEFHRVRLGIGHPGDKDLVHNWVLGNFAKADSEWLDLLFDAITRTAPKLIAKDLTGFMSDVAVLTRPIPVKVDPARGVVGSVLGTGPTQPAGSSGPTPAAKNAMAETLRALLAGKRPPGRRPGG